MADLAARLTRRLAQYEAAVGAAVGAADLLLGAVLEHHPDLAPVVSVAARRWSAGLRSKAETFHDLALRANRIETGAAAFLWSLDVALTVRPELGRILPLLDASHAECQRDGDDYPGAVMGGASGAAGGRDTHLGQALGTWAMRLWTQQEAPQ
jgi:hypothetical protein